MDAVRGTRFANRTTVVRLNEIERTTIFQRGHREKLLDLAADETYCRSLLNVAKRRWSKRAARPRLNLACLNGNRSERREEPCISHRASYINESLASSSASAKRRARFGKRKDRPTRRGYRRAFVVGAGLFARESQGAQRARFHILTRVNSSVNRRGRARECVRPAAFPPL